MSYQLWSWLLMAVGVTGLYLAGRRSIWGLGGSHDSAPSLTPGLGCFSQRLLACRRASLLADLAATLSAMRVDVAVYIFIGQQMPPLTVAVRSTSRKWSCSFDLVFSKARFKRMPLCGRKPRPKGIPHHEHVGIPGDTQLVPVLPARQDRWPIDVGRYLNGGREPQQGIRNPTNSSLCNCHAGNPAATILGNVTSNCSFAVEKSSGPRPLGILCHSLIVPKIDQIRVPGNGVYVVNLRRWQRERRVLEATE